MYQTSDYDKARKKLKKAESQSDLQTEAEENEETRKRQKRPNPRYNSDSETEEESPKPRRSPRKTNKPPPTTKRRLHDLPQLPTPPSPLKSAHTTPERARDLVSSVRSPPSKTTEFEVKVLTSLEQIKSQVQHNTKLLQQLGKRIDAHSAAAEGGDDASDPFPSLPVKSMQQLEEVDDSLKDEKVKNCMIRHLSTIGGDTIKQSVKRVMSTLMINAVALKMNWMGKGEKRAFSTFTLREVLIRAVRGNRFCRDATDKEIEDAAKDWLRFSKDRDGGRKERRQNKKEATTEQKKDD